MKVVVMLAFVGLIFVAGGCKYKTAWNEMRLVSYRNVDSPRNVIQHFEGGSYTVDSAGQYDILLENHEPFSSKGKRILFQSIRIRTIWTPIPGRTYAESSQINANIDYTIKVEDAPYAKVKAEGGYVTLRYHGSGFVVVHENRSKTEITGSIENAELKPARVSAGDSLGTFILSGKFRSNRAVN